MSDLISEILNGNVTGVKLLLERGANPNMRDEENASILQSAIRDDYPNKLKIIKLLLVYGANPNSPTSDGSDTILGLAVQSSAKPNIIKLLLDYGANPNKKDIYGFTPLFSAVAEEETEIVRLLLNYGANPLITDNDDKIASSYITYIQTQDGQKIPFRQTGKKVLDLLKSKERQFLQKYKKQQQQSRQSKRIALSQLTEIPQPHKRTWGAMGGEFGQGMKRFYQPERWEKLPSKPIPQSLLTGRLFKDDEDISDILRRSRQQYNYKKNNDRTNINRYSLSTPIKVKKSIKKI
jgi:hypothetical protein